MFPAIEEYFYGYRKLPHPILAYMHRQCTAGREWVHIGIDERLTSLSLESVLRTYQAHELGHVILEHEAGFVVSPSSSQAGGRRSRLGGGALPTNSSREQLREERDCKYLAAYLLIPRRALEELEDMDPWYISRRLGVLQSLVPLRFEIIQRKNR